MAPSWFLLDRRVYFSHDTVETKEGEENTITALLQTLKPKAQVADPPQFSYIHMLSPTKSIPPPRGACPQPASRARTRTWLPSTPAATALAPKDVFLFEKG
jgi:hypothetical protein